MSELLLELIAPRTLGLAFSPLDEVSLKTWLAAGEGLFTDTARTTPAIAEDAHIAAWADKSGLGNHVTEGTDASRPHRKNDGGLNGYPAVNFNGTSHKLSGPTLTLAQPTTYFVVARVTAGAGNKVILGSTSGAGQNNLYVDATSHLRIYDGATELISSATWTGDWHTFAHAAKSDPDLAYADGVSIISGASGSQALTALRLGADQVPGSFMPGDILEVVVCNALLSASRLAEFFSYFDRKFGISGVAPLSLTFPFGVFEDLNVQTPATFATMLTDTATFGMDSVMLTNGNVPDGELLAAVADARGVPITVGPLAELNVSNTADLVPLVRKFRRHRSIIAIGSLRDEPLATDAAFVADWVSDIAAIDTSRPSFPVLVGTDRVQPIYDAALPGWLVVDVYPCCTDAADDSMDFHMGGFGYSSLVMEDYLKRVTQSKLPNTPLIVVLQTHGLVAIDLRVPSAREIRLQFWEAVALGANGISWFAYKSQQGWVGLDANAVARAELLSIVTNDLTAGIRSALARTVRAGNEWTGAEGVMVRTLGIPNAAGTALGTERYVVACNPTLDPITTELIPILGPARSLTKMKDGTTLPGVVSNTYTLPSGHGLIFQTAAQVQAEGVPDYPIDWTQTPSERWADHPFNPDSGTYVVETHPVAVMLNPGDSIQDAIDALPLGPATIVLGGTNGHYAGFNIYGRNNLHIVAPNGAIIDTPPGTTDYKDPIIRIGPHEDTLVAPGGYAAFNAGVDTGSQPWLTYFLNPVTDIYIKGLIFDGGGLIVRPVTMTCVRRVMFDGCTVRNLMTSAQITTASNALGDGLAGFHFGSFDCNVRAEQITYRGCTFTGPGRWGVYLDGSHGATIVGCNFNGSNYGGGCWVGLTNDDVSYSDVIPAHVATTNDEKRSAMYGVFANNNVTGSIDAIISYSGGNALVKSNTINAVHIAFGFTARGSNKWGPNDFAGGYLIYYHYGNEVIGNSIATLTAGPENGAQGIVYGGASHCGVSNTPSGTWQSPTGRSIWGRIGSGIDPLVPGVTKTMVVRNNIVTTGPVGLVLINPDNVVGEPGPMGTLEGVIDVSGNTNNGNPLNYP